MVDYAMDWNFSNEDYFPDHIVDAAAESPVYHDDFGDHGYHINDIPQGEFGELSKVAEELFEALDADEQGSPVLVLMELSDIVGAIDGYLARHHPSISVRNLFEMSEATKRAFTYGDRVSKS